MTTYHWHYDIPVKNAFDPDRLASVLLPADQDAPAELSADNRKTLFPDGYHTGVFRSAAAWMPDVFAVTPRELRPCMECRQALTATSDANCPECGGRGYVEAQS